MTVLLGFYRSNWWYFGKWNKKMFVLSTPIFQFIIAKGDLIQDIDEELQKENDELRKTLVRYGITIGTTYIDGDSNESN